MDSRAPSLPTVTLVAHLVHQLHIPMTNLPQGTPLTATETATPHKPSPARKDAKDAIAWLKATHEADHEADHEAGSRLFDASAKTSDRRMPGAAAAARARHGR